MTQPFYLSMDNADEAHKFEQDIVYLYFDALRCYMGSGFYPDLAKPYHDVLKYLNAEQDPAYKQIAFVSDIQMIREGAAVVVLSDLSDMWEEWGEVCLTDWDTNEYVMKVKEAFNVGDFDRLPEAKNALIRLFATDTAGFIAACNEVVKAYIVPRFRSLVDDFDNESWREFLEKLKGS